MDFVCYYFVEDFYIYNNGYRSVVVLFVMHFSGFGVTIILVSVFYPILFLGRYWERLELILKVFGKIHL